MEDIPPAVPKDQEKTQPPQPAVPKVEEVQLKTVSTEQAPRPKAQKKPTRQSSDSPGTVTLEKLLDKLASLDAEPQYASFVKRLSDQLRQNESAAAKKMSDKERELDRLHDQLEAAHTNLAKIHSLEQSLKESSDKYKALEKSLQPKDAENKKVSVILVY